MDIILKQQRFLQGNRLLALRLLVLLVIIVPVLIILKFFATEINVVKLLNNALEDIDILRKRNLELQKELENLKIDQQQVLKNFQHHQADEFVRNDNVGYVVQKEDLNAEYEIVRRRIINNIKELRSFIDSEIIKLQQQPNVTIPELLPSLQHILDLVAQHTRWLLRNMDKLAEADGYATWRKKEVSKLNNLVQRRFFHLQNPPDCKKVKKIVCDLRPHNSFGGQVHRIVFCFIVAYKTQRTLILKPDNWYYSQGRWNDVFKPISNTCIDFNGEDFTNWPKDNHTQVLDLPPIHHILPTPSYLPLAIPEDLALRLVRLHDNPIVWWIGQILKFVYRPNQKTAAFLQNASGNLGFKRPIVGVHVRRTDKIGTEAKYHSIEEYMSAVDEYYNQLQLKENVDKRRIYLATDDPEVITKARNEYPHYEILGNSAIAKTASVDNRCFITALKGIILDLHMLSMSDFLVCTFSSQVCRLAYEIMQNYFPDASAKVTSLDDIYYFAGQSFNFRTAIMAHDSNRFGEIQLLPGDLVSIDGNHWNGYSKGRNLRTNQTGLFPSFKVRNKVVTAKFPTYSELYNNHRQQNDEKKREGQPSVKTFNDLLNRIQERIKKQDTLLRESVSAKDRLIITLRYLATGETMKSLSYSFRVGHSTISNIIPEVCTAVYDNLKTEFLKMREISVPFVILADAAFPLAYNILKPFPFRNITWEQRIFNYRLSRARRVVENAFGILTNRFRIFLTTISLNPDKVRLIVLTCVALHNYLLTRKTSNVAEIDTDRRFTFKYGLSQQGGNHATRQAMNTRKEFMAYFNGGWCSAMAR
ncbi:hypothetical protein ILUMI_19332 [Ignelater luminosus]|uniref:Alpha-(1,6)-fucosyltransferase n=1 Tax=Ignelater luminosus TaxID=2038154 RepID=A0A8K0G5Z5_IGNLU|nr:hypothetical protein ILUMI_19332 [Ignelater luminosus]